MLFVAITRNEDGLGASIHITEAEAEASIGDDYRDENAYIEHGLEYSVDVINLNHLWSHVSDPVVRLALITNDSSLADQARGRTFSAWWDDNNEGEQVAQSLPSGVYEARENAILAMGDNAISDDPVLGSNAIPADFWKQLAIYWAN